MSKMEDNMDKALAYFYKHGRIESRKLFLISGAEDIQSCIGSLIDEGYISFQNIGVIDKVYEITAKGRAFHEKGAFAALRKQEAYSHNHNLEILNISRKTLWFAKYGFWVTVISTIAAIVAIVLALR